MTVAAAAAKAGPYTGNDSASAFTFAFKVFADTDIRVVSTVIATGVESDLVLNTNYTVARNADQDNNPGGTVTYKVGGVTTAYPSTRKLTIVGDFTYEQPTDIPNGGAFFATVIENALDRVTLLIKQVQEKLDRAVVVDVSSPTDPTVLIDNLTTASATAVTSAGQAAASAVTAAASAVTAADWATKVGAAVTTGLYSAKEWAIGTFLRGGAGGGSAKDWATYTGGTVDDTEYSAKKYANDAAAAVTGMAAQASIQTQAYTKFTAGGTADAITGTLSPAITAYTSGLRVTTTPSGANTVTTPTLNLNALGVKTIKKRSDGGTAVALVAADYNASGSFDFVYDGTDFILLNPLTHAAANTDVSAGSSTSKLVTPAALFQALNFSDSATPADQTITSAGLLTIAHGRARAPFIILCSLICQTAEANWSAGNEVFISNGGGNSSSGANAGHSIYADATNIYVRFGSGAAPYSINDKTSGVGVPLTNANWKLRIRSFH